MDRRRGSDGGGGCVVPDDRTADLHRDRGGGADTGGERREQLLCKVRENILGCDADSVSLFNLEGKELWKESIQFQKPIMEVSRSSAAVAELRGNEIAVFGEDGLRGQIKTTLPIEKMAVSSQGITAVILENGGAPVIQCFDVSGNVLIEYKVSAATSGYPVDLALSPDGTKLLVSYMMTQNSEVDTQLAYYDLEMSIKMEITGSEAALMQTS